MSIVDASHAQHLLVGGYWVGVYINYIYLPLPRTQANLDVCIVTMCILPPSQLGHYDVALCAFMHRCKFSYPKVRSSAAAQTRFIPSLTMTGSSKTSTRTRVTRNSRCRCSPLPKCFLDNCSVSWMRRNKRKKKRWRAQRGTSQK